MTPPTSTPSSTGAPPAGTSPEALRHSPLEDCHRALDAKLVEFGGWLMPLAYGTGTLAEHRACRSRAVAFDVSHLGTVRVEGPGAVEVLQSQLSNDLRKITPGRAQYTHLLDPDDASVVDDIIVWWIADGVFDVMPNASNTGRVRDALGGHDTTAGRAVIAVQGPDARRRLASVVAEAAGGGTLRRGLVHMGRGGMHGGRDRVHGGGRRRVRRPRRGRSVVLAGPARRGRRAGRARGT